jgi:hypothetical protein
MKKTKLFFGNQYVESFNCDGRKFTKFQILKIKMKRLLKKLLFWFVVVCMLAGVIQYFRWAYPTTITKEVVKEVIINQEIKYPILDKIAMCESNNKHFDTNGQVLVRGNTGNRASVDVGTYQVNIMYHGKKATEMGLNLFDQQDNRTYAVYLFETQGTEPWSASKKCWIK